MIQFEPAVYSGSTPKNTSYFAGIAGKSVFVATGDNAPVPQSPKYMVKLGFQFLRKRHLPLPCSSSSSHSAHFTVDTSILTLAAQVSYNLQHRFSYKPRLPHCPALDLAIMSVATQSQPQAMSIDGPSVGKQGVNATSSGYSIKVRYNPLCYPKCY